ncbi:hypothetical protein [Streptomyces sp. NPDC051554]|uniref:hypothetical protein n=1 Tax=Streptomyces sp. NPDC051554 TaxID=3365656 RepID=UPI00378AA6CF
MIGLLSVVGWLGFIAFLASPIWMAILGFMIGSRTTVVAVAEGTESSTPRLTVRTHRHRLTLRHH